MTVREEIDMLNRQAEAIRRTREEMEAELREIERTTMVDEEPEEEPLRGRWAQTSGGWVLEAQNDEFHFCDPCGWRIIAFLTPTLRRNAWIMAIGPGESMGVHWACRRHTYPTLEEAQAATVKLTGVAIVEEN